MGSPAHEIGTVIGAMRVAGVVALAVRHPTGCRTYRVECVVCGTEYERNSVVLRAAAAQGIKGCRACHYAALKRRALERRRTVRCSGCGRTGEDVRMARFRAPAICDTCDTAARRASKRQAVSGAVVGCEPTTKSPSRAVNAARAREDGAHDA